MSSMPKQKEQENLDVDTITREQIIELINKENKRRLQVKESMARFVEKHREAGDLSQIREQYKMKYYKKKLEGIKNPEA